MPSPLTVQSFGPFAKGAIDSLSPLLDGSQALSDATNLMVQGVNRVLRRGGTTVAQTYLDDQGTPAPVTSIRLVQPFKDRVVVLGHSTVTSKTYVYLVDSAFTGYYNTSDTFTASSTAHPLLVLYSSQPVPPDIMMAEGLGAAYFAHTGAISSTALNWPTYQLLFGWTWNNGTPATNSLWNLNPLVSDLDGSGAKTIYFLGVASFQQHLWGWGFGHGATAATGFNPSLMRWSNPIFGFNGTNQNDLFNSTDDLTLGDRVDSAREQVISCLPAGEAMFCFSSSQCSRMTGYGTDSWQKDVIDKSYGIVGAKAGCVAGDYAYYWSNRGPMRMFGGMVSSYMYIRPEPLWDRIAEHADRALSGGNPAGIVAGFARDQDQVQFFYQQLASEGPVRFAAYDVRRDQWMGPDSMLGVGVASAGAIEPIYSVTSPPAGPAGPPVLVAATNVGTTSFQINWTVADSAAETYVRYRLTGTTDWTEGGGSPASAGQLSYVVSGLTASTSYDVEVQSAKNGQVSAVVDGLSYATTIAPTCLAPTKMLLTHYRPPQNATQPSGQINWTVNEPDSQTVILVQGPSDPGFYVLGTTAVNAASYVIDQVPVSGTYTFEIYAIKANYTASPPTPPQSVSLDAYGGV